ncbi:MAG TPA: cytochrome c oxidase subunit II [Gaiellaceae bacterium]|nr:cytochrome c oxidase subunit II [Gaiellaceae bacterium]
MRGKLSLVVVACFAVLVTAGVAAASNGGFAPESPHSTNARRITSAYWLIFGLTAGVFVIVETVLVVFIWKYRSRGRDRTVEGAQVHGHTRLEVIWTVIPVGILAVIAAFVFYELPGIADAPAATDAIHVTVEAHQFYWQFDYPNGVRSINDLTVPVGRVVDLTVVSPDVVHSWWIPALGGKIQAIPGQTTHTWFRADAAGTYTGQCAELCGLYHAAMRARVIATTPQAYGTFIASGAAADLGRSEYVGACATCHGMHGEGGYGPNLQQSPLLAQPSGLEQRVRQGGIKMPPVGDTWTAGQMRALASYVRAHVYKGAASGG